MKRWCYILIGAVALGFMVPDSYASCGLGRECPTAPIILAQNMALPPHIIAGLQRQFNGRVVGITPSSAAPGRECREFHNNITIDGQQQQAFGTACLQPDGSWRIENNYDVQVLTQRGKVIIVTIDPSTGRVIGVRR